MDHDDLTQAALKAVLSYDPSSGLFVWNHREQKDGRKNRFSGLVAGTLKVKPCGYRWIKIGLNRRKYAAHRLAWLYMTGDWPRGSIDHIDRDATNNRWANLRLGDGVNGKNMSLRHDNKSGVTGVSWDKRRNKWRAVGHFTDEGGRHRHKFLGYYDDLGEAAERVGSYRKLMGYESGHGKPRPLAVTV